MYRTIAQAQRDGERVLEIIQLEMKLMSNAAGNEDFQLLAVAKEGQRR